LILRPRPTHLEAHSRSHYLGEDPIGALLREFGAAVGLDRYLYLKPLLGKSNLIGLFDYTSRERVTLGLAGDSARVPYITTHAVTAKRIFANFDGVARKVRRRIRPFLPAAEAICAMQIV
jgi:hypothetical protein